MNFNKIRKSKSVIIIFITTVSILSAYLISTINIFHILHLKTVNTLFTLRGPAYLPDSPIVIVAIDDQAYASLPNKYPFPTFYYGRLVRNLYEAGARLIVFDIEFTETDLDNQEGDIEFAKAVTDARNVVLAGKIVFEIGSNGTENRHPVPPIDPLLRSPASWGLVNAHHDEDMFIREYLLFYDVTGTRYYSLGLEAIKCLDKIQLEDQDYRQSTFNAGSHIIKKASGNTMYINFVGPAGTIPTYSLANVLDDSTFDLAGDDDTDIFELHKEWGTFRDKIVFIGATADELQDNKFTPFLDHEGRRQLISGVEVHANALSTILRDAYITDLTPALGLLWVFLFAGITTFATLSFKTTQTILHVALQLGITALLGYYLFSRFQLIPPVVLPTIAISLSFIFSVIYQTVTEQQEKARIKKTFQHYVSPSVVQKMLETGDLPSYGGERKLITVLFSDIRKFTNFSESHKPEVVVTRLSEYLTEMVNVVFKYNGTLDKFVGDAIMAVYGAPYSMEDHAEKACYTAIEMVNQLRAIQRRWSAEKVEYFQIGIGINTGKVIVGNLGSSQLFDYTVIGDEVNLGARLEGTNKQYGTTIIISESTFALVKNKAKVRELDLVRVVGRKQPIRIFELRGMDSIPQIEQDYIVDIFEEGIGYYREKRWADALKTFRRVLRYFPTDGPSRIYTKRCLDFIENPPPNNWDGVYDFKTK
jgi:adenylate cyclase